MKWVALPAAVLILLLLVAIFVNSIIVTAVNSGDNVQTYNWALFLILDWLLSLAIMIAQCRATNQLEMFQLRVKELSKDQEKQTDLLEVRRK